MNRKPWPILVGIILVLALAAALWGRPRPAAPTATLAPALTPSPTPTPSPAAPASPTLTPYPTVDWGPQPTVTPPAPGEPTIPAEALAMRAAPTATPSPIPSTPTYTPSPTPTFTPVPATGHDDVEMVEVPAGEFLMGTPLNQVIYWVENYVDFSYSGFAWTYQDQTPQIVVDLDSFEIDQVEVTVERYQRCIDAGICQSSATLAELTGDVPVVGVSWYDANAYCQWVGKRLPTEAEWEKAGRGTDGRMYPWGNEWRSREWIALQANIQPEIEALQPVGSYPQSASVYGVLDMMGNAWEWVADEYLPYSEKSPPGAFPMWTMHKRVLRGGGVWSIDGIVGPSSPMSRRWWDDPAVPKTKLAGFRCARGPEQAWRQQIVHIIKEPTPETQPLDLSAMAYIPAGEFLMGSDADPSDARLGKPAHIVYLDAYYIDRYEVTVAEYVAFLNALPERNLCNGRPCIDYPALIAAWVEETSDGYQVIAGFENRPIINVFWDGAQAYCAWVGKRLPTEAEWEKAARGTDGRKYPWGNEWQENEVAIKKHMDTYNLGAYPLDVGTHPGDRSPYGVYDMLSNATELVFDFYSEEYSKFPYRNPTGPESHYHNWRTMRGLAGSSAMESFGLLYRSPYVLLYTGFRCAYKLEPSQ